MKYRNGTEQGKIRVLINGLHAKSGGGVTVLRNLLPRLAADRRLDIHLTLHTDQQDLFHPIDPRITVHWYSFSAGFLRLLVWEQFVFPAKARHIAPDVTMSAANYGPLFVRPAIILLQNALAVGGVERRLTKRFYWLGLAFMTGLSLIVCARAIAISAYTRDRLGFGLGSLFGGKIDVVYPGVDDAFSPGPAAKGEMPYLLVVADIYVQKNLHTLIEALNIIHRTHPALPVKIAGRKIDDDYHRQITGTIDRLGLADSVHFLGEQNWDQLVSLYRTCAVFVLPSTVETFGFPLVEAMACGAPVATSNVAAMPEIVGDGAALFDPSDAASMAKAILLLLDDKDYAKQLSERGRRQAARYSWDDMARQTADILLETAARRHR